MAKALVVIELDDEWLDRINTSCDEMLADVTIYKKESLEDQCDYTKRLYRCFCPLKPMPKKMDEYNDQRHPSVSTDDGEFSYYACGWNAFRGEITGKY